MTSSFIELEHIFVKAPSVARRRVGDFLAVLKTYWWASAVFCSLVWLFLFGTFNISILYFIFHKQLSQSIWINNYIVLNLSTFYKQSVDVFRNVS